MRLTGHTEQGDIVFEISDATKEKDIRLFAKHLAEDVENQNRHFHMKADPGYQRPIFGQSIGGH